MLSFEQGVDVLAPGVRTHRLLRALARRFHGGARATSLVLRKVGGRVI